MFLRIRIRGEFESKKKIVTRGWKISEMRVEFHDLLLSLNFIGSIVGIDIHLISNMLAYYAEEPSGLAKP